MTRPSRISPRRSAPSPSASGPMCADSASAASGESNQAPARFFGPPSVMTSRPPPWNSSWNAGVFGPFSPAFRYLIRPALIMCRSRTSSPSSVGKSSRFPRRTAPERRRPSRTRSGGSKVFSVAMCAGPALAIGKAETGSSSERRSASTSGSSGTSMVSRLMEPPISVLVRRGGAVESVHRVHAAAVPRRRPGRRPPAIPSSSPSCAPRPSRCRHYRSRAPTPTCPTHELAIACASHLADADQLAAAQSLSRACARARGRPRVRPRRQPAAPHQPQLLGQARGHARRLPCARLGDAGYRLAEHPLQRELHDRARGGGRRARDDDRGGRLRRGHLRPAAASHGPGLRCPRDRSSGGDRIAAAMRARPELIRGERAADTMLMRALPGWIAKGGAEGLMCAAGDGSGCRAEGRGRLRAGACGRRSPSSSAGSDTASRPASELSTSRTRAASGRRDRCRPMKNCFRSVKNGANIRSAKVSRGRCVPALCASQVGLFPVHQRRESRGQCSPSTSRFQTLKSFTSSSRTDKRRASSPTTRSSRGSRRSIFRRSRSRTSTRT